MRKVTRTAPAKINLGLDVTGTRPDGYHLLETVFQAVSIADTVTVELIDTPDIALTCDVAGVPCSPKNIAWKAAQRYLDAAGLTDGVQIHIEKRIPMEAGMGGGSTDGAAVLLALQELTGNALSMDKLAEIAVSLGADVPFFLYGGTAYAAGIGEKLEKLPAFSTDCMVIARGQQAFPPHRHMVRLTLCKIHSIRLCRNCGRRCEMGQLRKKLHRFAATCSNWQLIWTKLLRFGRVCWNTMRFAA